MASKDAGSGNDKARFGSGTPGNQGTYSAVGAQPDGGGAGLGAQVESGDGTPQDIVEAGGDPSRGENPGPDSGEATESAVRSYERTERSGSGLNPGSGDRNTASGAATEDLSQK